MSQFKKVTVECAGGEYPVLIGDSLLPKIADWLKPFLKPGIKILIVSNYAVAKLFLKTVKKSLKDYEKHVFFLPNGDERDKSIRVLEALWERMAGIPMERGSLVVALGGGVVGDAAGFAASTYMRGIRVVQVPTTLLAQVDSAIGGKTAVNLKTAKNIVGTFHQPAMVISDIDALASLSAYELANQFAEVVKYGVIADPVLFSILEKKTPDFFNSIENGAFTKEDKKFLMEIVWRSAKVKAGVVSQDEKETKGMRMHLNYGHTFAHGFETASGYRLSHGNAVAIGMLCAGRLATKLGLWTKKEEERQANVIRMLPELKSLRDFSLNTHRILFSMARDKKKKDGQLRFVLPVGIGEVKVVGQEKIPQSLIAKVIDEIK